MIKCGNEAMIKWCNDKMWEQSARSRE